MLPIRFTVIARQELNDAIDWYAARSSDVAARFVDDIDPALTRIGATPRQFPVLERGVRRAQLRGFPYGILFHADDQEIIVVGCFHGSRSPRRWQERT